MINAVYKTTQGLLQAQQQALKAGEQIITATQHPPETVPETVPEKNSKTAPHHLASSKGRLSGGLSTTASLAENIVDLKNAKHSFAASATLLKAQNEMIGKLLEKES